MLLTRIRALPFPTHAHRRCRTQGGHDDALAALLARLGPTPFTPTATLALVGPTRKQGVTQLALALACEAHAAWNVPVFLVEAHWRRPRLGSLLGIPAGPGLAEYLAGAEPSGKPRLRRLGQTGLTVLPAGTCPPSPLRPAVSARWPELLAAARERFGFVLLDLPPADAPESLPLARGAGTVLLVAAQGRAQARAVRQARELFRGAGVRLAGAVLTRT